MKMLNMFLLLVICYSSQVSAITYYVDSTYGNDTYIGTYANPDPPNGPLKTIKEALSRVSSNDKIKLIDREYLEEVYTKPDEYSGNDGLTWKHYDDARTLQINININNLTIERYSGTPTIIGFSNDELIQEVMRVDASYVTINHLTFDGYHEIYVPLYDDFYAYVNAACSLTPDADYSQVLNCTFTNFGKDLWTGGEYDFYNCLGGYGFLKNSDGVSINNPLQHIKFNNNTFNNNPFTSQGAHEIYLNYVKGTSTNKCEVKNNDITNNCAGHPLKVRRGCDYIVFDNNTVRGGHYCFIGDYPNAGEPHSSNTEVTNNTFMDNGTTMADSITYYEALDEHWAYQGPLGPSSTYIEKFSGNTIWNLPSGYGKNIHGLTYLNSNLYFAQENGNKDEVNTSGNPDAPSPANKYGVTASYYHCQGDMCTTNTSSDDYVIFCTQNSSGSQIVYKDKIDGAFDGSPSGTIILPSYDKVTALASIDNSTFLCAVRHAVNDEVYIYNSSLSYIANGQPLYTNASVDSITAMAYDGTDVLFATYNNGTSRIYKDSISFANPSQVATVTGYISAMCFARSNLVTAVLEGSTQKLYYGTKTNPLPSTNSQTLLSGERVISLAGGNGTTDDDYLYTLIHDTGTGEKKKKIYFTNNMSDYDQELYFYSEWYRWY